MFIQKAANYLRTNLQHSRISEDSNFRKIIESFFFSVAQQPNSDLGCFFLFLDRTQTDTHTHTHTHGRTPLKK